MRLLFYFYHNCNESRCKFGRYNITIDIIAIICRNRIALLQKEEERSRKKIDQTKEKAEEIAMLRMEHQRKIKEMMSHSSAEKQWQVNQKRRNLKYEIDSRRHKIEMVGRIKSEKKSGVEEMKIEKTILSKIIICDQQKEYQAKKSKYEMVKRMEEVARRKREIEKAENERKMKEYLSLKAKKEEETALKAEQMVKILEAKERAWILKLQNAQRRQEQTVKEMEDAIIKDGFNTAETSDQRNISSAPKSSLASPDRPSSSKP